MDPNDSAPGATPPAPRIPDHELLRRIGRGSYGEVWLARSMMGILRAIKIVYRKSFENQRPFDRELSGIRKFEPISRSHEGLVDVLHVGIKEGEYFYYVMELGDDQASGQNIDPENYAPRTLANGISLHGRLPFDECLKLGLALSLALAELHKHNLVHRDVKPSNIIFVNGVPKLADIGLVTDLGEARSYVGTEGFIPPEGPGAPNADVYGLGKVLYECSTGKDRHDFPELPTLLDKLPDYEKLVELNEVILHACKAEAKRRYQSAWDMHLDLLMLANGKSVKRLRFLEQRLAAAKKIAGVSVAVLIFGALVAYQINRERRVSAEALQRQIGADVANGDNALAAGDAFGALPYFALTSALDKDTANQKVDRLRFALTLAQCPALVQMWFVSNSIFNADFHPDSRRILISQLQGRAQVFDIQTGQAVSPPFGQTDRLRGGAFNEDGTLVVTASEDKTARVWKAADGTELFRLEHPDKVLSANFSPDGKHILTGCLDGVARVWNCSSQQLEYELRGHAAPILFAAFSHQGQLIVTTSRDNSARIWSAATGRQMGAALEHTTWVNYAAFSPDDRELATACFDHKARIWEVASGRLILPEMSHDDSVNSVEFSPDGRYVVTAGLDHTARIWYAADHRPVEAGPILWHSDRVTYAAFAPDGHQIITTSTDGTARVWDLAGSAVAPTPRQRIFCDDGRRFATVGEQAIQVWDAVTDQPLAPPFKPGFPLQALKFSPDGNSILAVAVPEKPDDSRVTVELFEAATGQPIAPPYFIPSTFTNFSLSLDGQRLLTLGGNQARTWNASSGTPLSPLITRPGVKVLSAVFNPDASKLALWAENWVELCDASSGQELFLALEHEAPVRQVEFSRDGSRLVTCSTDLLYTRCSARVWDAATGRAIGSPLRHADGVLMAAFSPDGNRVVTASEDYTAMIWDVQTSRQLCPSLKHKSYLQAAVFSPDGNLVATVSDDKTARIWNAKTGEALSPPLRHVTMLEYVKFLPDGKHLLTANRSGASWIWKLPEPEQSIEQMQKLACLLTSGAIVATGFSGSVGVDALKPLWQELRTNSPLDFAVSSGQITAWNEFEAEQGEADKRWFATLFHSQQMLANNAADTVAVTRLERARRYLLEQGDSKEAKSKPAGQPSPTIMSKSHFP